MTCKKRRLWKYGTGNRKTYLVWRDMRRRCNNPKSAKYEHYGARGIKVCEHWNDSFDNFFEDMGSKPERLTLERVDNNQGYSPDNCVWADYKTQNNNQRSNNQYTKHRQKENLSWQIQT